MDADEAEGTALFYKAKVLVDVGNIAAAEQNFRQALMLLTKRTGHRSAQLLFCLDEVGCFLVFKANKGKDGLKLLREALGIAREQFGSRDKKTATAMQNLAVALLHEKTDLREAEGLAKDAASVYEEVLGSDSPWTKQALETLQDSRDQLHDR